MVIAVIKQRLKTKEKVNHLTNWPVQARRMTIFTFYQVHHKNSQICWDSSVFQ
jgi:hypothetical protein